MAETEKPAASGPNEGAQDFARSGRVEDKAKEARDALDSPEGDELRRAEEKGKSRAAEEDLQLNKR